MKRLDISIQKLDAIHKVQSDTFLAGVIDKATDPNASPLAYHEQAGDNDTHMSVLNRSFVASTEGLLARITDYSTVLSADFSGDVPSVTLLVPDRFNVAYTNTLPRLMQEYIQDDMIAQWWSPINPNRSQVYLERLNRKFGDILRCFNRTIPIQPEYPYPVSLSVDAESVSLSLSDGESQLSYSVDGALDDIQSVSSCHRIFTCENKDGVVTLTPVAVGEAFLVLFSLHDETKVYKNIEVNVSE